MAGDMLQKFMSSVNRGVTAIRKKASSTLEKTKIKIQIESVETDIRKLFVSVGEAVYAAWECGEQDYASVEALLSAIQQKKAEAAQLARDMAAIDTRDTQALGNTGAEKPAGTSDPEGLICPGCGALCASTAKFCRMCGHKLQ